MPTEILPCFPLNLVAFPGEKLNLHIFEPRYRQMINESESEDKTFVICPHFNGKNIPWGTEMKLVKVAKRYDNGKMDVRTEGIALVKIDAFYKTVIGKLYPGAEIERQEWDNDSDFALNKAILSLLRELYSMMDIEKGNSLSPIKFRTFQVGHKVGFNFQQELEFLKLGKEKERQQFMRDHLNKIIPIVKETEAMKVKARLNGHFKNEIPPAF